MTHPNPLSGSRESRSAPPVQNHPRTGLISQFVFETMEEVQEQATRWLWTYNNERPNMAIGGVIPAMKLTAKKLAA